MCYYNVWYYNVLVLGMAAVHSQASAALLCSAMDSSHLCPPSSPLVQVGSGSGGGVLQCLILIQECYNPLGQGVGYYSVLYTYESAITHWVRGWGIAVSYTHTRVL